MTKAIFRTTVVITPTPKKQPGGIDTLFIILHICFTTHPFMTHGLSLSLLSAHSFLPHAEVYSRYACLTNKKAYPNAVALILNSGIAFLNSVIAFLNPVAPILNSVNAFRNSVNPILNSGIAILNSVIAFRNTVAPILNSGIVFRNSGKHFPTQLAINSFQYLIIKTNKLCQKDQQK